MFVLNPALQEFRSTLKTLMRIIYKITPFVKLGLCFRFYVYLTNSHSFSLPLFRQVKMCCVVCPLLCLFLFFKLFVVVITQVI